MEGVCPPTGPSLVFTRRWEAAAGLKKMKLLLESVNQLEAPPPPAEPPPSDGAIAAVLPGPSGWSQKVWAHSSRVCS